MIWLSLEINLNYYIFSNLISNALQRGYYERSNITRVRDSKSVKKLQFQKKELSTSVDRKAARNQHQSQQIGWENLVKSQKW